MACDLCGVNCNCYEVSRRLQHDRIQEAVQAKLERIRIWAYGEWSSWMFDNRVRLADKKWANACYLTMLSAKAAKKEAHNEWRGMKDSWL